MTARHVLHRACLQKLTTNVVAGVVKDKSDCDTRLEERPKLVLAGRRDVGQNLVGTEKRIRCVDLPQHLRTYSSVARRASPSRAEGEGYLPTHARFRVWDARNGV